METPASVHDFSTRPFPEKTPNFDYDSDMRVLKITKNGAMRWGAYNWVYLSASLQGKYVGAGKWEMEFGEYFIEMFFEDISTKMN